MSEETHLEKKVAIARLGFSMVPTGIFHSTLGAGLLHMGAEGLRFDPFDKSKESMAITWEEFDRGPGGES